jgi:tetratricopeptide (TPR) repeat protein
MGHWSKVMGHWSSVIGHWSLVAGHWSLVTGHRSLINGSLANRSIATRYSLLLLLYLAGCASPDLPGPGSDAYRETVTAFYKSVASVQSGEGVGAETNLRRAADLAPAEPAVWYNQALLALRANEFGEGRRLLDQARTLAPENSQIVLLLGIMESNEANADSALARFREAIALDPDNLKARFALAQEIGRLGDPTLAPEAAAQLDALLERRPTNQAVLVDRLRMAVAAGETAQAQGLIARLYSLSGDWSADEREPLVNLREAVTRGDLAAARVQGGFLRNLLLGTYRYRQDLGAVQTPLEEIGELMTSFVRLPAPSAAPAPADTLLAYRPEPLPHEGRVRWAGVFSGTGDGLEVIHIEGTELIVGDRRLDAGPAIAGEGPLGVAALDLDYNFRNDLAVAGAGGLVVFAQDSLGAFASIPVPESGTGYTNVWAADVDSEGDIDLILAKAGAPVEVLRNNGNGTFSSLAAFSEVLDARDFAWADFDGDGDPDAAFADGSGTLHIFANQRLGQFIHQTPGSSQPVAAIAAADLDANAVMEVVSWDAAGTLVSWSLDEEASTWAGTTLSTASILSTGQGRLFAADLDNNGALDVVASAGFETRVWLANAPGDLSLLPASIDGAAMGAADLTGDGLLDLLAVSEAGAPRRATARGTKGYHWQILRPRAGQAQGDQRINAFTIGGEVELRAGLLFQKAPITSPIVHLGLGAHTRSDVIRIIWPNGDVQSEFDLEGDDSIFTPQRLKGSCPWLFTFDGQEMRFVTDFIWRSPLGLRINAQQTAGVVTTEDWVKIPGEALAPRDGIYDVRITAELWETHYFDHISLLVVDHPADTEVFVDERFAVPAPAMEVHTMDPPRPVARVGNDRGEDVTDLIRTRDGRHIAFFGPGRYQGITREHTIEIDLGDDFPVDRPASLVAFGWVRPTDSSINVAISQGDVRPRSLSLEVPDDQGGWRTVRENLGFPAGKTKTVLVDLTGLVTPDLPKTIRLRTNLEIYWDEIRWATHRSGDDTQTRRLDPVVADLRYRGFSALQMPDRASPETPVYDNLESTGPRWRDLDGYYTRFGDVRELLAGIDDRYVIMNAGDEMRFAFPEQPAPPAGWKRDFVLIGDGWVKDGDYNTVFGKTVLPLPSHTDASYDRPPTRLVDDPVYLRFPGDWQAYHTRYVGMERFREALAVGQ